MPSHRQSSRELKRSSTDRIRRGKPSRWPRPVWLMLLALFPSLFSGCGVFYSHHYRTEQFTIHTDLDSELLEQIGPQVTEIYRGFEELFDVHPRQLGRTSIILRGSARDMEVVDLNYSPTLLGYYVPLLNLISVDTKPSWSLWGISRALRRSRSHVANSPPTTFAIVVMVMALGFSSFSRASASSASSGVRFASTMSQKAGV